MWDLPRPGLEPVSPALAGRFLNHCTTREAPRLRFLRTHLLKILNSKILNFSNIYHILTIMEYLKIMTWVQLICHYNFTGNTRHNSTTGNGDQHKKSSNENHPILKWMILTKYFYNQKGKGSKLPKETTKKRKMRELSLGSCGQDAWTRKGDAQMWGGLLQLL